MKLLVNVCGEGVTIHNTREEILFDILMKSAERINTYISENAFGDDTIRIVNRCKTELQGQLSCMYFLGMTSTTLMVNEVMDFVKNN